MEFTLPFPPSLNTYWRSFARGKRISTILSEKGRQYREVALGRIPPQDPVSGPLEVSLVLFLPDKRRRDVDNYIKAVFDALTHAGVWHDDEQVVRLHVTKMPPSAKEGYVLVSVKAA